MFSGCSKLSTLDLSTFSTRNVTNWGEVFGECNNHDAVDLSTLGISDIPYVEHILEECVDFGEVDSLIFNLHGILRMREIPVGDSVRDLLKRKTSGLTGVMDMFRGCDSLSSVKYNRNDKNIERSLQRKCANDRKAEYY